MDEKRWIQEEIAAWRTEGLIDGPTAARLLERYPVSDETRRSFASVLIGAFGALLIGFGVIALLAANWDCFGRTARAAISIAPTVACGIAALVAVGRRVKTAAFWEPLSLLWSAAVVAGTSLVAQTYQIGGSASGLVLLVALLTLPIAWFVPAAISRILWLGFPIVWAFCRYNEYQWGTCNSLWSIVIGGLLLTAVSIPGYALFLRSKPGAKSLMWGQALSGLAYTVGTATIICLTLFNVFDELDYEDGVVIYWLCAALLLDVAIRRKIPMWAYLCAFVSVFAALPLGFSESIPFYCAALVLAGVVIGWGIRTLSLAYTNLGAVLLLVLILAKFFRSDLSFTVKGIVLLLCGVALTVFNILFIRFRRERRVK